MAGSLADVHNRCKSAVLLLQDLLCKGLSKFDTICLLNANHSFFGDAQRCTLLVHTESTIAHLWNMRKLAMLL